MMQRKEQILLVEDDDDLRDATADALGAEGFEVSAARDGAEALTLLRGAPSKPALILLDLMMPTMNGFEFREQQLKSPDLASIPVVVLTASLASKASSLGAAAVLRKPITIEALVAVLDRALSTSGAR